jgi:soluble cytochrome b562
MKTPHLLALLLVLAPTAQLRAESPAPATAAPEENAIEDQMETMGSAFKKLRRQVPDPAQNASSLELVAKLRKASVAAQPLTPEKAAKIPEADRARFVAAYAEKMTALIAEIDKLEAALKADKNDEAATALARLGELQKEGHREFRPKKKE